MSLKFGSRPVPISDNRTIDLGISTESALFQLATRFRRSDDGSTKISSLENSYLDSVSSAYTLPEYVFSDHHIRIQLWIQSIYRVPTFSNRSTEIGSVEDSSTKIRLVEDSRPKIRLVEDSRFRTVRSQTHIPPHPINPYPETVGTGLSRRRVPTPHPINDGFRVKVSGFGTNLRAEFVLGSDSG